MAPCLALAVGSVRVDVAQARQAYFCRLSVACTTGVTAGILAGAWLQHQGGIVSQHQLGLAAAVVGAITFVPVAETLHPALVDHPEPEPEPGLLAELCGPVQISPITTLQTVLCPNEPNPESIMWAAFGGISVILQAAVAPKLHYHRPLCLSAQGISSTALAGCLAFAPDVPWLVAAGVCFGAIGTGLVGLSSAQASASELLPPEIQGKLHGVMTAASCTMASITLLVTSSGCNRSWLLMAAAAAGMMGSIVGCWLVYSHVRFYLVMAGLQWRQLDEWDTDRNQELTSASEIGIRKVTERMLPKEDATNWAAVVFAAAQKRRLAESALS